MAERKRLAVVALALGIFGLFSAGGLVVGSLLGLALAGVALTGASSARGGRDVAWAAIAANVFALLTVLPLVGAVVMYRSVPFPLFDDALPTPVQRPASMDDAATPPSPPPPPTTRPAGLGTLAESGSSSAAKRTQPTPLDVPRGKIVRVGATIPMPRKTRNVNPVYPKAALDSRVQGVVVLEITISPSGKVVEVRTLKGSAPLTEAAIAAVRQWEYTPTVVNGVAMPVVMTVTVNFDLR